jgi:hypothetical protein
VCSFVNIYSTTLVSKLNLCTVNYAKLYRLQLLNNIGEVKVTKQVMVPFLLGSMLILFYAMWCQCKQVIFYWRDHDIMIGRQYMMVFEIDM